MRLQIALLGVMLFGGGAVSLRAQKQQPKFDPDVVASGRTAFRSSCGFCHGEDAAGNRAPDLIRSPVTSHDENGDLLIPVIRNGRPDKGMPAFGNLNQAQITAIVTFLHSQAYEAMHSAHVPGDYPLKKLLTGNAATGKAYFNGAGRCASCHSVSGDLEHVASKYTPIELQQRFVYPGTRPKVTAKVTLRDGRAVQGELKHRDEFEIALVGTDGWYHSWPATEVKIEVDDPLEAHRELIAQYTDSDVHNLFAYLETLK